MSRATATPAAPRMRAGRVALVLLLLALSTGCGRVQFGDTDQRPYWRHPTPAPVEPQERYRVPDDGFLDHLAVRHRGPGIG